MVGIVGVAEGCFAPNSHSGVVLRSVAVGQKLFWSSFVVGNLLNFVSFGGDNFVVGEGLASLEDRFPVGKVVVAVWEGGRLGPQAVTGG